MTFNKNHIILFIFTYFVLNYSFSQNFNNENYCKMDASDSTRELGVSQGLEAYPCKKGSIKYDNESTEHIDSAILFYSTPISKKASLLIGSKYKYIFKRNNVKYIKELDSSERKEIIKNEFNYWLRVAQLPRKKVLDSCKDDDELKYDCLRRMFGGFMPSERENNYWLIVNQVLPDLVCKENDKSLLNLFLTAVDSGILDAQPVNVNAFRKMFSKCPVYITNQVVKKDCAFQEHVYGFLTRGKTYDISSKSKEYFLKKSCIETDR